MFRNWLNKWIDKYLIFGALLLGIQYLIFITFDFIVFSWFCFHHIFEMTGFLFIGIWFGDSTRGISPIKLIVALIPAIFVTSILISGAITLGGVGASAIVFLCPLLIGYWLKKWWQRVPKE